MKETELMDEESLRGKLSSLGDRVHKVYCCEHQNEDLLEIAIELWKLSDQANNETSSEPNVKSITIVTDKFFFIVALASLLLNLYLMM